VDELVERLHQAGERTEHKKNVRREEAAKAEDCHTHHPKLNRNSIVMASGVESLEMRMGKIKTIRADKLERAIAKKEEQEERETTGQPTITAKGARHRRGIEALQRWDERRNQKNMMRQHQRFQENLQECTFQPNVNGRRSFPVLLRRDDGSIFDGEPCVVHNRLHEDAHRRRMERTANDSAEAETKGGATPAMFKKRPGSEHNVSVASYSSTPRPVPKRSAAARQEQAQAPEGDAGKQPLAFADFMRSLAAEHPNVGWSSGAAGVEEQSSEGELAANSMFFVDQGRGRGSTGHQFETISRQSGRGSGFGSMMSDAEDEIFMADAPPQPSRYPPSAQGGSTSQSPRGRNVISDGLEECALPEWVKFAMPVQPIGSALSTPSVGKAPTAGNSAKSSPRQATRSAQSGRHSARSSGGSPASANGFTSGLNGQQNNQNVMNYTSAFDDVFRIGYGGQLPGTI
jgi:hypothetical protein